MDRATSRGITRWFAREFSGSATLAAILMLGAGTARWPLGWVLVGVVLANTLFQAALILPRHPQLLADRARRMAPGTKTWDRIVLGFYGTTTLAVFLVAALDHRWAWTPTWPLGVRVAGALLVILGNALTTWAMAANAFFAFSVRIQSERDHRVATGGPYRLVRHPGYAGAILYALGAAVQLGSAWALVPAAAAAGLLVARTALEDRTLHRELPGYAEFATHTRFRLIPGIW